MFGKGNEPRKNSPSVLFSRKLAQRINSIELLEDRRLMSAASVINSYFILPLPVPLSGGFVVEIDSRHALNYVDADGTKAILSLSRGTGEITFDGTKAVIASPTKPDPFTIRGLDLAISSIVLSGTDTSSALFIRNAGGGDGHITVGKFTDTSPIGKIIAPAVTFSGSFNVAGVKLLRLGNVGNAQFQLGSTTVSSTSIHLGDVANSSLSAAIVDTLQAKSWTGSGTVFPLSITRLIVPGEFSPTLNLSSVSAKFRTLHVAKLGKLSGNWIDYGHIDSINVTGDLTGSLFLGRVQSMHIGGDISNVQIETAVISPDFGYPEITVGGSIINSSIHSSGPINSVTAKSIIGSTIISSTESESFPLTISNAPALGLQDGEIRHFKLTGSAANAFTNSTLIAFRLDDLSLGDIASNNAGIAMGLVAHNYQSLAATFGGKHMHLTAAQLANPATITKFVQDHRVAFGDFAIEFMQ